MYHDGEIYVSLLDFIETMCNIDNNEAALSIGIYFCNFLTSKYSFEGNKCFKAEASDKTKHIMFPYELVLEIFMCENIKNTIIYKSFNAKISDILSKKYTITHTTCCCCPKKLKKAVSHAASFSDFVRQGQAEVRRFQSLKSEIKFLVSLDIEGKYLF